MGKDALRMHYACNLKTINAIVKKHECYGILSLENRGVIADNSQPQSHDCLTLPYDVCHIFREDYFRCLRCILDFLFIACSCGRIRLVI
jgi:hypothetical protein